MEKRELTCINCPMGCQLEVTLPQGYNEQNAATTDPSLFGVTGNACKRGDSYARKEFTTPTRTLTCTIAVQKGVRALVSAKTKGEIPKDLLLDAMQYVRDTNGDKPKDSVEITGDITTEQDRALLQTIANRLQDGERLEIVKDI